MKREIPTYETPPDARCSDCGEACKVVALRNEFSYSGTHCTYGKPGIEYPSDWGRPVSDCCEAEVL